MQLTSTTGSGTDSPAGTVEYGWMLRGWVSFNSGTRSISEYIRGRMTWLVDGIIMQQDSHIKCHKSHKALQAYMHFK